MKDRNVPGLAIGEGIDGERADNSPDACILGGVKVSPPFGPGLGWLCAIFETCVASQVQVATIATCEGKGKCQTLLPLAHRYMGHRFCELMVSGW